MRRTYSLLEPKSLKFQLRFYGSIFIVFIGITIFVSLSVVGFNHAKETAVVHMENTIDVQSLYIDRWFSERASDIKSLANRPYSKQLLKEEIREAIDFAISNRKEFDAIHFINREGVVEISSANNPPKINFSDREYFIEAMKGKEHITDVFKGRVTGQLVIVFSCPVMDEGESVQGVIIGSVTLKSIDEAINTISRSPYRDTYILNREGYMLTESVFLEELKISNLVKETTRMELKVDTEIYKEALKNKHFNSSYINYRGKRVFGCSKWANNGRLLIVSEIGEDFLMKGLYKQVYTLGAYLALILGLLISLILKLTKKMEEPIEFLLEGTNIICNGNYKHRIDEASISSAPAEFISLCSAFNTMTATLDNNISVLREYSEKLEQSNTDLQQFAYIASHDLQEPLRMVVSYLQLIERRYKGKLDKDADDFINFAVGGAKRMQTLINDLLAYSRISTKGKEFSSVDCNNILKKVLYNLEFQIKDRNAAVTYEALPKIYADETQLIQLFQNLIGNGIKFNDKESPRIHISSEKVGGHWRFSVKDNGIGVPRKHYERIFTIFQRLHTQEQYEGTGIGLGICKRIVQRHGGEISLQSIEAKGTTFYFTIPTGGE